MKKLVKLVIILIVLTGVIYVGYAFYINDKNNKPEQTVMSFNVDLLTSRVENSDIREVITATGTVYLEDEQSIYASGEAKVKEVLVEEGDVIDAGHTLVIYDTEDTVEDLNEKIEEAQISLDNQNISLQNLTLPITKEEEKSLNNNIETAENAIVDAEKAVEDVRLSLESLESSINQKKKDIEQAEKDLNVSLQLLELGAITLDEYDKEELALQTQINSLDDLLRQETQINMNMDTAQNNLNIRKNDLEKAKENLEDKKEVLSEEADKLKYEQQENQVKLTQLTLNNLRKQLADVVYDTKTDVSGTVTSVNVERGSMVDSDIILVKVADFDKLIVKANISEYDVPSISIGQQVEMTTDGLPGAVYFGTISKINDFASLVDGEIAVEIEISLDNVDDKIKPGFSLDCDIIIFNKENVISIPITAILKDDETGESYVYSVDSNRILHKQIVSLGDSSDSSIELISGLSEDDSIVRVPTSEMTEGSLLDSFVPADSTDTQSLNNNSMGGRSGPMVGGSGSGTVMRRNGG